MHDQTSLVAFMTVWPRSNVAALNMVLSWSVSRLCSPFALHPRCLKAPHVLAGMPHRGCWLVAFYRLRGLVNDTLFEGGGRIVAHEGANVRVLTVLNGG